MIAAPDHLARRGMNPSVRPRERHANAQTKVGPDTALPKLPAVPVCGSGAEALVEIFHRP